jgi:voltage-gated potassium channel
MTKKEAVVFGYNEYAKQIAKQIDSKYRSVRLYVLGEASLQKAKEEGFDAALFDLSDNWDEIERFYTIEELLVFCALDDDAENIFLTISLRATFQELYIVSLARNQESANKLKIAGANKIVPILQTTANIITEILEKPVVTDVLHGILYEKSDIKIAQVTIGEDADAVGKKVQEIAGERSYGVIILAVVDDEMSAPSFVFTSKGSGHTVKAGDILIVLGYDNEIKTFERKMGGRL